MHLACVPWLCMLVEKNLMLVLLRPLQLGRVFPEHLAVYYTIKMVHSIEILHEAQVLHGDVKPDNWLVVPGSSSSVLQSSSKAEKAGFRYQTGDLSLIDFGRAIDLASFPPGTTFVGDCHTKGFQTTEMISNKPWTKQIDTFGICATTHCMLFGDYMDVVCRKDRCGRELWSIKKPFKRYWEIALWKELFDTLLNVKSCAEQPSLSLLRQKLEAYFTTSPQREQVCLRACVCVCFVLRLCDGPTAKYDRYLICSLAALPQELHELLGRQDRFFSALKV